jgi:hypothetical protein
LTYIDALPDRLLAIPAPLVGHRVYKGVSIDSAANIGRGKKIFYIVTNRQTASKEKSWICHPAG